MKRILLLTLLSLVACNAFGMDRSSYTRLSRQSLEKQKQKKQEEEKQKISRVPIHKRVGRYDDEFVRKVDSRLVKLAIQNAPERIEKILANIVNPPRNPDAQSNAALFLGESGNGKTLLAKAMALELGIPFYLMQAIRLMTKYKNCHENIFKEVEPLIEEGKPIVVIFDEFNALTDQHNDTNSSDKNTGMAFWALMDACSEIPNIFLVCTSNNNEADFQDQIISRFGKNIITVPKPNLSLRKAIINYHLGWGDKHNLSSNYINQIAHQFENRTCREVVAIIADAIRNARTRTQVFIIQPEHVELAIKENPRKLSKDEIFAQEANTSTERAKELQERKSVIEKNKLLIEHQHRINTFEQQERLHKKSLEQNKDLHTSSEYLNQRLHYQTQQNTRNQHRQTLEQNQRLHNESQQNARTQHQQSFEQNQQLHNQAQQNARTQHRETFDQNRELHNQTQGNTRVQHRETMEQGQRLHNESQQNARTQHQQTIDQTQRLHNQSQRTSDFQHFENLDNAKRALNIQALSTGLQASQFEQSQHIWSKFDLKAFTRLLARIMTDNNIDTTTEISARVFRQ